MDRLEYFKHLAKLGNELKNGDDMAKKKNTDVTDDSQDNGFNKKWAKLLSADWMTMAESFSTDEIKKKIVQWEQAKAVVEKDMDSDAALNALKERAKELKEEIKEKSEPYTKSVAETDAQIKYGVYLLEQRGVSV